MLDATERRALTLVAFAAACICMAPAEFISGGVLLLVSLALYRWDLAVLRREGVTVLPPAPLAGGSVDTAGVAASAADTPADTPASTSSAAPDAR